jgi:hypothetical protein
MLMSLQYHYFSVVCRFINGKYGSTIIFMLRFTDVPLLALPYNGCMELSMVDTCFTTSDVFR